MIESLESYREAYDKETFHDVDVDRVAKIIDKEFQKDFKRYGYKGYEIDRRGGLIVFKVKTGDEERIYFDPYTMRIHLQNDLWIDEFNSDLLLGMIDDLEFLISNYNLRVAENIKEKWGFDHD